MVVFRLGTAVRTNPCLFSSLIQGLISSSESSGGDESDPDSSNSGDSAFSEDINKMVRRVKETYSSLNYNLNLTL